VDADALLAAVQDELRRTFGHRLAVVVQPAPHPWTVTIDRAVVHHALLALAAEAVEAMPHGGTLTFRTMNVEVGTRRPSAHITARPGRYVRVEVSYLTSGVPVAARPQRRMTDDGGVAAMEALRRAGGRLMADSDGERVSSVVLLLPSDGVTVLKPRDAEGPRCTGKTVVLVEQDATHRRLLQAVLRGQGHDVDTAASATDAVRRMAELPDAVLVTDAVPGDTPIECASWLTAHPDLRVLCTSETLARASALLDDGHQVLAIARPLAAGRLIEAVSALFTGQGQASSDAIEGGAVSPLWLKHDGGQPIHPLEAS
jgi:CheY-like chemotaxis protein